MKKFLFFPLVALMVSTSHAGFGKAFGGSVLGSFVGSSVANAANKPDTVVVREERVGNDSSLKKRIDDLEDQIDEQRRETKRLKSNMKDMQEENDRLTAENEKLSKENTKLKKQTSESQEGVFKRIEQDIRKDVKKVEEAL